MSTAQTRLLYKVSSQNFKELEKELLKNFRWNGREYGYELNEKYKIHNKIYIQIYNDDTMTYFIYCKILHL